MEKDKKKGRFWSLILFMAVLFFLSGTVSGVRELLNMKKVTVSLSDYMTKDFSGSKLELTEGRINSSVHFEQRRKRRLYTGRVLQSYYLVEPKIKVDNPARYVFVTGERFNPSEDEEKAPMDSEGYRSFIGWKIKISDPGLKGNIKKMIGNPDAEIVLIERGIHSVKDAVVYPFIISAFCFMIILIRAAILNVLEKSKSGKS